ncbi:GATA transcription factor 26 isoform X2 [Ananas comosus]|uniref:GATA transcription factor 26 isoform X2 n=1 Tax=Ananas comosus TaxID=4615 RepID=A0A6P5FE85_ANACO|nr:GATA transcription factor 26 isoform X2 [Ananas comosus]
MGKHGPCGHCGVTSTPLWRNGPPEKPVLCNACGSRWRTKGSLTNYTPLHAREAFENSEKYEITKPKSTALKPKEHKLPKKKQTIGVPENESEMPYSDQNFQKIIEGDTSNRSCSGSASSFSSSCAHIGTTDASSAQSNVWVSLVPSKKRTYVNRPKPSPLEKLTKDLYSIMHEQQSSNLSATSEEDLVYQNETPMGSFEIGYGSVLIRHPNSKSIEEESEASSIPVNNKSYNTDEAYSGSATYPVHSESKGANVSLNAGSEKAKKCLAQAAQENAKRDKISHEKLQILRERDSPLSSIDLKEVVNYESFLKCFTLEEQQQLLKYLPSIDTAKTPESLRNMFGASQFVESLSCFQKLLREGVFTLSFSGANAEECRILKRLVLVNLTKSKWVEYYQPLKDKNCKKTRGKEMANCPNPDISVKRPREGQNHSHTDVKGTMRSPKRIKPGCSNLLSKSDAISELVDDTDGFSPRSFFSSPPDRISMLVPPNYTEDNSDQDLLLDVPFNASFPEAELLYRPSNQKSASSNSLAESGIAECEGSFSNKETKHW